MTPAQALKYIKSKVIDAQIAQWAGVSRQAVGAWKKIPAERVLLLEKHPEIGLTRHQMRRDIYGDSA